jgi:hypothetical protein
LTWVEASSGGGAAHVLNVSQIGFDHSPVEEVEVIGQIGKSDRIWVGSRLILWEIHNTGTEGL